MRSDYSVSTYTERSEEHVSTLLIARFLENSIPLPKTEDEAVYIATRPDKPIQTKIDIEKEYALRSYEREKQYLLRQMFI